MGLAGVWERTPSCTVEQSRIDRRRRDHRRPASQRRNLAASASTDSWVRVATHQSYAQITERREREPQHTLATQGNQSVRLS